MKQGTLVTVVLALCAIAGFLAYRVISAPETTDTVPGFVLATTDGGEADIRDFLGRPLVINFWATWCPPCLREMPLLVDLHRRHGEEVQVVGVAIDRLEPVLEFMQRLEVEYPVLVGEQDAMLAAGQFGDAFIGLPFTVFADADGRILGVHTGEIHAMDMAPIEATLVALARGELAGPEARRRLAAAGEIPR
jgi:thiol-disulfide isomerase/thioredoxin